MFLLQESYPMLLIPRNASNLNNIPLITKIPSLKTSVAVLLLLILNCTHAASQKKSNKNDISFNLAFPISDFAATHFIGTGIDYSPARSRQGLFRSKSLFPTYNVGGIYYFG